MANLPFGVSRTGLLGSTAQVGQSLGGGPSMGHPQLPTQEDPAWVTSPRSRWISYQTPRSTDGRAAVVSFMPPEKALFVEKQLLDTAFCCCIFILW